MEIKYELTKKDYIDFNIHMMYNFNTTRRSLYIQQYILPLIFLIIPFVLVKIIDVSLEIGLLIGLPICIIAYLLWVVFYPKYFKRYMKKYIEKILNEGNTTKILGNRSLLLKEEGIFELSNLGETKTNWSTIEKIEETEKYIFIYLGLLPIHVVPTRAFENINKKNEFISMLKQYCKNDLKGLNG